MNQQTRVDELTVEELISLIRAAVREELYASANAVSIDQSALLELKPLSVGEWPENLTLLNRDEYYDDKR